MFTRFLFVSKLVAVLTLMATPSAAAVSSKAAFREERAFLGFTNVRPLVCEDGSSSTLIADMSVTLVARRDRGQPARVLEARAEMVLRNGCTGAFQEAAPLVSAPDAEISGVDGATLEESIELFEYTTGEPLGFLDVALVFEGSGEPTHRLERDTSCSGGLTTRTQSRIETRLANVEGMVSLNGFDLLDGVERFGDLQVTRTQQVTRQRAECACSGNDDLDGLEGDAEPSLAGATVTRTEFDTNAANSSFRNVATLLCADGSEGTLETTLSLNASAQVSRINSETASGSEASAFLLRTDSCSGETLVGFAPVTDPDFDQLGTASATLDMTFELTDPGTGAFVGELAAALTFSGAGAPSCQRSFSITRSPAGVFGAGEVTTISRTERETRSASLAGSVSFDGSELVNDVEFADLSTFQQTNLTIEH